MNLPNKITVSRLCLIPVMIFAFYTDAIFEGFKYAGLIAAVIFCFAAFTDFLDGYIARKYSMVTDTGKFLDPIADKVLVLAALFLAVEYFGHYIFTIAAIIIITREFAVSALRQVAATKKVILAADKLGKYKAVCQYAAMIMLLFYKTVAALEPEVRVAVVQTTFLDIYRIICVSVLFITVVMTIWSGLNYIIKNRRVFKPDDQ